VTPPLTTTMMKKLFLFTAFCLTYLFSPAQEWSINYVGNYPNGRTHFHDGIIDEDGVTFLAGQEGYDSDTPEALFMRIDPNGEHREYIYPKEGFHSKATCIIETTDHNLFAAGNLYDGTDDCLLILILDKQLNLLEERQIPKEMGGLSFGGCKATLDSHDNIIVSTFITMSNGYQGTDQRGAFYKFDHQGNLISHRYLIGDYPDPVYFLMDFQLRQFWYNSEEETLLCLAPGYGNVMSFITFDSAFNYIEEHPIWQDDIGKSDHTLSRDCYTDHWFSENEALFFSSRGDADHNKLRVSHVNTQGEILDYIRLNERTDTIDDAAPTRCMAASNRNTFYFSFYYHTLSYYPGNACVYLLNDQLEIIGRHIDNDLDCYRSCLILATPDGGCITVNDSCNYQSIVTTTHPIINKLNMDDFETIPLSIKDDRPMSQERKAYPNPCDELLHIPIAPLNHPHIRCQVIDHLGRIVTDRIVHDDSTLDLDVSTLKAGLYHYRIYADQTTLFTDQFIKK